MNEDDIRHARFMGPRMCASVMERLGNMADGSTPFPMSAAQTIFGEKFKEALAGPDPDARSIEFDELAEHTESLSIALRTMAQLCREKDRSSG